jgi:hypothetical protein
MASPERLMRAEEDITALSYTILDIKGTLKTIMNTLGEVLSAIRPAK